MNNATLVETLRPLPRIGRVRLGAQIDRLQRACGETQELEPFLEEVLEVLCRIFGGTAGAFWFRPWGAAGICPSVRTGFADLPFAPRTVAALDTPVARHWQSIEPAAQFLSEHNATVLVGPIRDGQEPIGAVQLVLLASESAGSLWGTPGDDGANLYRRALRGILSIVQPALLRRMRVHTMSLAQAHEGLDALSQQITGIQRSIRLAIERYLQQLSGAAFGSLEDNQHFVRGMQELLDAHGLRVRCPECGHPSILRCSRNASVSSGVFVFDHYLPDGRTFHGGGRTLPSLRITTKPARRKSS